MVIVVLILKVIVVCVYLRNILNVNFSNPSRHHVKAIDFFVNADNNASQAHENQPPEEQDRLQVFPVTPAFVTKLYVDHQWNQKRHLHGQSATKQRNQ